MRSKEGRFLGKLEEESFLEKLEGATHTPPIAKLTPIAKYMKIQWEASLRSKKDSFLEKLDEGYSHPSNS